LVICVQRVAKWFAYGQADVTATHHFLRHYNPERINPSRLSRKKAIKWLPVCLLPAKHMGHGLCMVGHRQWRISDFILGGITLTRIGWELVTLAVLSL